MPRFRPSGANPDTQTKTDAFGKWRAGRRVTNKYREESPERARAIIHHALARTLAKPAEALC